MELQQIQEQATALAEQNATLQRELDLARHSISGTSAPAVPSTSATYVGGPEVQESGRNAIGLSTPIGGAVDPVPLAAKRSGAGGAQIYLESSILQVLWSCSSTHQRTLCGFRSKRTAVQLVQQRELVDSHPMLLGVSHWR